ncbi:RnfABCDGE type electron transport complex subunit D [Clostridium tunisiense]|uniref:RnfABCDGE type electron transport complex subunit D n=1 Tax=Clostridium tunisiense TaxID=219748 RepID=UPI0003199FC0|nr:RnfABCDGE type electron transport complex subunit D [Clostridium tunisiense]
MSERLYTVSTSPHIKSKDTVSTVMRDVLIALLPAAIAGIYFFGLNALLVILTAVGSAVLSEYAFQKITKRPILIKDLSAVVTGLLLAFNVPPTIPLWMVALGSAFAIIVVKCFYGGIGQNIVNPALAARAFLLAAYPVRMTTWTLDGTTGATPLGILRGNGAAALPNIFDVFVGNIGGCIGETSALALLIGAAYLLYKKVISWHIPVSYIGTVFVLTTLLGRQGLMSGNGLYEIFLGGLILGAFYMATDYTTSPMTKTGHLVFGISCGILTTLIRLYGGYAEGVSYSILIMNLFVPFIDKFTNPRVFGGGK